MTVGGNNYISNVAGIVSCSLLHNYECVSLHFIGSSTFCDIFRQQYMINISSESVLSVTPGFAFPVISIPAAKCQDMLRDKVRI